MDWDRLQELQDLTEHFTTEVAYVDSEINGAITEAEAPTITVDATFILDPAITGGITEGGHEIAGQRRYVWRNAEGLRLDYFVHPEEGYFIAFGAEQIEKFMGNIGAHPFVFTKKFAFLNSDGSTSDDDIILADPTPEQVAEIFNRKTAEYLFNQVH